MIESIESANDVEQPFPDLIGQRLLAGGFITAQDLDKALAYQRQFKGRLGAALVRIGAVSEDNLISALTQQLGIGLIEEDSLPEQPAEIEKAITASGLQREWFIDQELVVWEGADGAIRCASRQPNSGFLRETLAQAFTKQVLTWHFIRGRDLERMLRLLQKSEMAERGDEVEHLRELAEEAPVIEMVNNILAQAIGEGASDIHVEPEEHDVAIRYRIDGVLRARMNLPRDRFDAIASRVKLISGMDIAERRLPQDGRISVRVSGVEMDIRASAVPGVLGESLVLRLLPKERSDLSLQKLGMYDDHLRDFDRWLQYPNGIILVTGPTGSGKSTTLYTALDQVNDSSRKIITVEDPVEYKMPGITQIQAHAEIGYTFARALRAILRQDPDVIMIGEIRDLETAEIAVQAALTGHLVLSTVHTNDALSAFVRLLDMGVDPFLVASSVRAVMAQRLVRRLCEDCARPVNAAPATTMLAAEMKGRFPSLFDVEATWRGPSGCPACHDTGYRGRIGIYELIEFTPMLQQLVLRRAGDAELLQAARAQGFRTLRDDGLIKAWRGMTSMEEIYRVTGLGDSV